MPRVLLNELKSILISKNAWELIGDYPLALRDSIHDASGISLIQC